MSQAPNALPPGYRLNEPEKLFSQEAIAARIDELAAQITRDVKDEAPLAFIAVANGAIVFAADLMRRIPLHMTVDTISAQSYAGTASTGNVASSMKLKHGLQGRSVLLVDDILDSGRTLTHLRERLAEFKPAKIMTCVMLDKPSKRIVPCKADYVGFEVPDVFIVGYGLDLDGYFRNLPYIGKL